MTVGADVKCFGLPGQAQLSPLSPSWMEISLPGAVLGIFPYPELSLEGQLCSVAGSWGSEPELELQGWPRRAGSVGSWVLPSQPDCPSPVPSVPSGLV